MPNGALTDFRRAVQTKDNETVVFSWIEWPDKETRDAGMAKALKNPRLNMEAHLMPFDGKRMIFGGFAPVVELSSDAHQHHLLSGAAAHSRNSDSGKHRPARH